MKHRFSIPAMLLLAASLGAVPAYAQSAPADIGARLEMLEQEVAQLRQDLATAKSVTVQARYGSMPNLWANWSHVAVDGRQGQTASLSGVFGQVEHDAMPNGGPQGLEAYVYDDHQTGFTRLTIGLIGNIEVAGAGRSQEVRSVQSGGVITGAGQVDRWVGLAFSRPIETVPGQLLEYDPITFDNGWRFVQQGEQLFLCPPRGAACRSF